MSSEKEDNMSAHILHPLMEEEDHPKDNNTVSFVLQIILHHQICEAWSLNEEQVECM